MKIQRLTANKKQVLPLLLLADEQEAMIDRYLERGELYVLMDSVPRAVCVVTDEGDGILEIKNLAVAPEVQHQGLGRQMIAFIRETYRDRYDTLQVGTGESPLTLPFYEACGFRFSHRIPGFFTEHYDHPIIEGGVLLTDMVYLRQPMREKERENREMKRLEEYVRSIPDFPEPGIIFRDVTTILQDADGLALAIDGIVDSLKGEEFDVVVGPESRGFIFGVPVAYAMHKGFVPVRKKGKLPCETVSVSYELEYGTAEIEMHKDSIQPGQRVVIVDDLIATGGTTEAMVKLIESLGGQVVKICFVMELAGLHGRDCLKGYEVSSLITYEGN